VLCDTGAECIAFAPVKAAYVVLNLHWIHTGKVLPTAAQGIYHSLVACVLIPGLPVESRLTVWQGRSLIKLINEPVTQIHKSSSIDRISHPRNALQLPPYLI
jgi:hypothetical protein